MTRHINPDEAWGYFLDNFERLDTDADEIARDDNRDVSIYISKCDGCPQVIVDAGGEIIEEELSDSEEDLTALLDDLYSVYIVPDVAYAETYAECDETSAISERESDLKLALADFLDIVLGPRWEDLFKDPDEFAGDALDSILEVLAHNYDLEDELYRPMRLINHGNGEEVFAEYPYTLLDSEN